MPTRRVSAFNNNFAGLESAAAGLKLPPNVMRMPKGPDSGKGFSSWCRQRMEPKRPSKAIPIVAPPSDGDEEDEEAGAASIPGIPDIHVEPASGSEDALNRTPVFNIFHTFELSNFHIFPFAF